MKKINDHSYHGREIDLILGYLKRERNLDFSGYSPSMVERRIETRLHATGASDMTGYLLSLEKNPEELDALLDAMTINVSKFFRNPFTFDLIEKHVLPPIIREKLQKGDRTLRIWSAGCSSGEETYSLAIQIREMQTAVPETMSVNLFGTDIDEGMLRKAGAGIYSEDVLGNVRLDHFKKYFLPSDGGYRIRPDVREMVNFSRHDLLAKDASVPKESVFGSFDMVLCRNVLIYFNRRSQAEVLGRLDNAISPGGFLVLGEAESLDAPRLARFREWGAFCKVFRKSPARRCHEPKGGLAVG